jgi:hypothetical protein
MLVLGSFIKNEVWDVSGESGGSLAFAPGLMVSRLRRFSRLRFPRLEEFREHAFLLFQCREELRRALGFGFGGGRRLVGRGKI